MNLLPARIVDGGDLEVVAGPIRLPIDAVHAGYTDRDVILGIRPEDLTVDQTQGMATFALEVVAIEALGPEVILIGSTTDKILPEIAARMPRDFRAPIGSQVPLHLDPSCIHLFDVTTTKALPRPTSERAFSDVRSSAS